MMEKIYSYKSFSNFEKAEERLKNSLRSGRFANYSQHKKQQIWNRLCRYAKQVGINIKASLVAACMAAGLCLTAPASAQPFVLRTGTANPLNGVSAGFGPIPTFADIDNDGDIDAFIGTLDGTILYYENTGSASSATFTAQVGAANPLNGFDVGRYAAPAFVDIDNDGDMDLFVGEYNGPLSFFKNTGTAAAPVFTLTTGSADPFNGLNPGDLSNPTFVDIDDDGDMDAFVGTYYGDIRYYKNTGTAAAAIFSLQTGGSDPFNGIVPGYYTVPAFVDIDGDGDYDAFVGVYQGVIYHYKNTGTAASPVFTPQTGAANPLDAVSVALFSAPAFADIDGDGDFDAFIGADDGTVTYYENTAVNLPLHLLSFSGSRQSNYNELKWSTAAELNTKYFEVERSSDGISFIKLATVSASGSGNNSYSIKDIGVYSGKVFYRLKMVDVDGKFTYSPVIWVKIDLAGGISIYPNPVKNLININVSDDKLLGTNAGIYDANGRLVQNILLNAHQVQVDAQWFSKGVYLMKFADGSGKTFMKE